MTKRRNSNIELLRIMAMLMIIAHHLFLYPISWDDSPLWYNTAEPNTYAAISSYLGCFGLVGVGLFFIISGYHMAQSKDLQLKKVLPIARKTWFYSLSILFLLLTINPNYIFTHAQPENIISSFFPILASGYWFVSQLIIIRLLYPYLRQWFDQMSDRAILSCFTVIILALFLPTFVTLPLGGYFQAVFVLPEAFYYTFLGYLIHRFKSKFTTKIALSLFSIAIALIIVLPLAGSDTETVLTLVSAKTPLCFVLSASIFRLFLNLNISSRPINCIGSLVFGVYLIHENTFVKKLLWQDNDSVLSSIYSTPPPQALSHSSSSLSLSF